MSPPASVSVIVPLAVGDDAWRGLVPCLPDSWELWMAAAMPPPPDWQESPLRCWLCCSPPGRAEQMNAAASQSTGDFLWFVHADTRPPAAAVPALMCSLAAQPAAVHYFDLRFYDGDWRMRINEWGARWRCALFKNPFGDQALCVPRAVFDRLGGFPAGTVGEDHLFVLQAAGAGVPLARVGVTVATSARTYARHGWWRTVLNYQRIWWRQWRRGKQ